MTFNQTAMLGALLFGLGAVFVLLPMARAIPVRLKDHWAKEVEAYQSELRDDTLSAPSHSSYTRPQQAATVMAAVLLGGDVAAAYGDPEESMAYSFYYFSLLLLVVINLKNTWLPDGIVLPTLWLGLLYHAATGSAADRVYGAAAGYAVPFLVACLFTWRTGREGLGRGDVKALAMAGAWFGLSNVPTLLGAFVVGGIAWAVAVRIVARKPMGWVPTGPAHLFASLAVTLGATVF